MPAVLNGKKLPFGELEGLTEDASWEMTAGTGVVGERAVGAIPGGVDTSEWSEQHSAQPSPAQGPTRAPEIAIFMEKF